MLIKIMASNMTWLLLQNFTVTDAITSKFIMSLVYSYINKNKTQVNSILNNVGMGSYYYGEENKRSPKLTTIRKVIEMDRLITSL